MYFIHLHLHSNILWLVEDSDGTIKTKTFAPQFTHAFQLNAFYSLISILFERTALVGGVTPAVAVSAVSTGRMMKNTKTTVIIRAD